MKRMLLAGVSALVLPTVAQAQSPDPAAESAQAATATSSAVDIVVTANRRSERLVDVPATVTAVTAEEVVNLKLFRAEDVAPLSPGLQLNKGIGGFNAAAAVRGVENIPGGAAPTVDFYFNDVAQDANYAINAIYDVNQIEVLRGPQGTLRGRPSPSGAITITTRRPDLDEFGGYAQITGTSRNGINGQFGLSIPLIADKLAIRLAGLVDDTDNNRVRSVNSGVRPYSRTWSGRFTVLAQPIDTLQVVATYQHLDAKYRYFQQAAGYFPGAAAARGLPAVAAGYNGPALTSKDRKAVGELPFNLSQNGEIATLQATLELPFNADLIYVGGYQKQKTGQLGPSDPGNYINNYEVAQFAGGPQRYWTHELRLQSSNNELLDYVVGGYYADSKSLTRFAVDTPLLGAFGTPRPFAFGSPGIANPTTGPINPAYDLLVSGFFRTRLKTRAAFGSVTLHATDRLDITAGLRYNHIRATTASTQNAAAASTLTYLPALSAAGPFFPTSCTFARLTPSNFGGFCNVPVTVAATSPAPLRQKYTPLTYNAAVRYEITDDVNVYASYGRSFRQGGNNIAALPADTLLLPVRDPQASEKSDSYEVGIKGTLLDRRLRFSVAAFQQDFDNLIVSLTAIPVFFTGRVNNKDLVFGADARVRGFEAELAGRITDDLDFTLNGAYAKGKFQDALIPCRTAVIPTAAAPLSFCTSNGSSSTAPRFTGSLQTEYRVPFGNNVGYIRTLSSYRSKATNEQTGFTAKDFATVNLFTGVRIGENTDISVFAKNLFDADVELARAPAPFADTGGLIGAGLFTPAVGSGYRETRRNDQREFGLSVRVQWGSR